MSATIQSAQSAAGKTAELSAILHGAAVALLTDRAFLRITGPDATRWLNGMVTNSIAQLAPGEGCYNFALNAQGHIQADLTAFLLEDSILLETSPDQIAKLLDHLNRFIIMDEVELTDITAQRRGLLIAGPDASRLLAAIDLCSEELEPLELVLVKWHSASIDLIHAYSSLVPKFEIWTDSSTFDLIAHELRNAGAFEVDSAALEQLRILEGTPRFGTDIRDKDLPQETAPIGGQSRALHFTKGCYLGQEIVERIHSRGSVHRAFSGFILTGALPTPGTQLEAEGKPVAELTSVASIHLPGQPAPIQLALGIIRREALENAQARNLTLTYPGGTASPIALPYAVPES